MKKETIEEWNVDAWFKMFQVAIHSNVKDREKAKGIIDEVEKGMRKLESLQHQKDVDAVKIQITVCSDKHVGGCGCSLSALEETKPKV